MESLLPSPTIKREEEGRREKEKREENIPNTQTDVRAFMLSG
jgi:hypothetical protein